MPSNIGSQIVSLKFFDPVDSPVVNKRSKTIQPTGIYSGGYLSKKTDTAVYLSALVCEIQSSTTPFDQIRAETQAVVEVAVSSVAPYVVLRWTYTGSASADYIDFQGVSSPDTYDLIVGKCSYSGAVLQGFTYAERSNPDLHRYFLKVEPEQTPSLYVRIRAGRVQVGDSFVEVPDQLSDVFVPPTSGSTTGAVYIDDDGIVQVSSDFTYQGQLVLAEIALTVGQTQITADNITDVRSFLQAPAIPDDKSIVRNSSGLLEVDSPYVKVADVKSPLANGGSAVAGSWLTRILNTELADTHSIASVGSNKVTLPAGTYRYRGCATFYMTRGVRIRLKNITDSIEYNVSLNCNADPSYGGVATPVVTGRFTITSAKQFELQYYCMVSRADNGLGYAINDPLTSEYYAELEFWKLK